MRIEKAPHDQILTGRKQETGERRADAKPLCGGLIQVEQALPKVYLRSYSLGNDLLKSSTRESVLGEELYNVQKKKSWIDLDLESEPPMTAKQMHEVAHVGLGRLLHNHVSETDSSQQAALGSIDVLNEIQKKRLPEWHNDL